jgi:hypothetical protein
MNNRQLSTIAIGAALLLLAACASSGVVQTGPDTYMVANSEWGFTSGGYQKAKAIAEADRYCGRLGRQIEVIGSTQHGVEFGKTPSAEVDFKCLPKPSPK